MAPPARSNDVPDVLRLPSQSQMPCNFRLALAWRDATSSMCTASCMQTCCKAFLPVLRSSRKAFPTASPPHAHRGLYERCHRKPPIFRRTLQISQSSILEGSLASMLRKASCCRASRLPDCSLSSPQALDLNLPKAAVAARLLRSLFLRALPRRPHRTGRGPPSPQCGYMAEPPRSGLCAVRPPRVSPHLPTIRSTASWQRSVFERQTGAVMVSLAGLYMISRIRSCLSIAWIIVSPFPEKWKTSGLLMCS